MRKKGSPTAGKQKEKRFISGKMVTFENNKKHPLRKVGGPRIKKKHNFLCKKQFDWGK